MGDVELLLFKQRLSNLIRKLAFSRQLGRGWQLMERNYQRTNLRLSEVAVECGLSKGRLNPHMVEHTGFTFHKLLTRYRLFRAVQMMMEHDYTLEEIADTVGFGTLNTFERHCKNLIGVRPREMQVWCRTSVLTGIPSHRS